MWLCDTHNSVEELLDLTSSFIASVLHMGNAAATGCQHCIVDRRIRVASLT
jgi:hypothetical protein